MASLLFGDNLFKKALRKPCQNLGRLQIWVLQSVYPMLGLYILSFFFIITGAALTVLRDPANLDYDLTVTRDGRDMPGNRLRARAYRVGWVILLCGLAALCFALYLSALSK